MGNKKSNTSCFLIVVFLVFPSFCWRVRYTWVNWVLEWYSGETYFQLQDNACQVLLLCLCSWCRPSYWSRRPYDSLGVCKSKKSRTATFCVIQKLIFHKFNQLSNIIEILNGTAKRIGSCLWQCVSVLCVSFYPRINNVFLYIGPQFLNNQVSAAGGALDCTILPSLKL